MSSLNLTAILLDKWKRDRVANFYIVCTRKHCLQASETLIDWANDLCREILQWNLRLGREAAQRRLDSGHPDILSLSPSESGYYKIEDGDFAELIREQSFHPIELSRKIYIVCEAHKIRSQYANKLLKTLEEPHPLSTIFFLNPSRQALLPTIESRGITLKIPSFRQDPLNLPFSLTSSGDFLEYIKANPQEEINALDFLLENILMEQNDYRQLDNLCRELIWFDKARTFRNNLAERFWGLYGCLRRS